MLVPADKQDTFWKILSRTVVLLRLMDCNKVVDIDKVEAICNEVQLLIAEGISPFVKIAITCNEL